MSQYDGIEQTAAVGVKVNYVYEAPVRLWHWVTVFSTVILLVTGYLIGQPPHSSTGEAYDWYVMGWIRFAHYVAAYVFSVAFWLRIWWAFVGNTYARQIFYLPVWSARWTHEFAYQLLWMAGLKKKPLRYLGHNPLANAAMFFLMLLPSVFMILTGFGMYAEAMGHESWQYAWFGWFTDLWVNTQNLHTWHRLISWVLLLFIIFHVYTAIREDIMSGQSVISTIINGERLFK